MLTSRKGLEGQCTMLTESLLEWFNNNGGKLHHAVQIAYDEFNGHHLRAKAKLDISTPLVYCPRKATLSVDDFENAESCWSRAFLTKFTDASPEVLVRFLLMHEYLKGTHSKWWPYLASLPGPGQEPEQDLGNPSLNTPLWFTEREKAWLIGTNIEAATTEREKLWQAELCEGISLLQGASGGARYSWSGLVVSIIRCGKLTENQAFV